MTYRPHRSHARYATVAAPANPPRRRSLRVVTVTSGQEEDAAPHSDVVAGIANALPVSILLWAGILLAAKTVF